MPISKIPGAGLDTGSTGIGISNLSATGTPSSTTFLRGDNAWAGTITSGTAVASTSGTSIDFTGIPSTAKRITVMFSGVSSSGASSWLLRIGDGSISATGYSAASSYWSAGVGTIVDTTGFPMYQQQASGVHYGAVSILNITGNTWVASGVLGGSNGTGFSCTGTKALTGTLDRIRLTTINGTDTFDAGTINIMWES